MSWTLWLAAALAAAPSPELEAAARKDVVLRFERQGRRNPARDPQLDAAALALAHKALARSAAEAAELLSLTAAVSKAGASDPPPRALVVRGTPRDEPLRELRKRKDLADEAASHLGVAYVEDGERAALAVLLTDRKAELEPFPHAYPNPVPPRPLCATLAPSLASVEAYVTRPQGTVERVPAQEQGGRHCAKVGFPLPGRHTVELLARGERGPEVVALFFVQVGEEAPEAAGPALAEPTTPAETRARVLAAINALRSTWGSPALEADERLDAVAQAYAQQMVDQGYFAHVGPDGRDMRRRLRDSGYQYSSAGENLGLASGPLAAHFSIEHSPGHRRNLLEPSYTRAGVGLARRDDGQAVLVEVYARPVVATAAQDPLEVAYAALAEARAQKGLPPLQRDARLERLATEHAGRALGLDQPKIALPGAPKLYERVFEGRTDLRRAAADVFVAESPALITESRNLADAENNAVGIGVVKGDSPTYGKARFWLVVLYAARTRSP